MLRTSTLALLLLVAPAIDALFFPPLGCGCGDSGFGMSSGSYFNMGSYSQSGVGPYYGDGGGYPIVQQAPIIVQPAYVAPTYVVPASKEKTIAQTNCVQIFDACS